MKKSILTIGLFSLMMILTSFTTSETKSTVKSEPNLNIIGSGSAGQTIKVDIIGSGSAGQTIKVDIIGSGSAGQTIKVD